MSSFSDYLENALLNHVFRNTALTAPTTVYLALYTAAPTDAGGGTQVSGGGYARQAITFGAPSGGAIANTSAVSFTATGAAYGTVVAVGIFDASTAGNLLAWDDITSAVINDGDTINFPIGDIDVTLT
jgi:predicted metal-binding membrane protein